MTHSITMSFVTTLAFLSLGHCFAVSLAASPACSTTCAPSAGKVMRKRAKGNPLRRGIPLRSPPTVLMSRCTKAASTSTAFVGKHNQPSGFCLTSALASRVQWSDRGQEKVHVLMHSQTTSMLMVRLKMMPRPTSSKWQLGAAAIAMLLVPQFPMTRARSLAAQGFSTPGIVTMDALLSVRQTRASLQLTRMREQMQHACSRNTSRVYPELSQLISTMSGTKVALLHLVLMAISSQYQLVVKTATGALGQMLQVPQMKRTYK